MTNGIPSKIGKFDVIEVLGRGGMGIVYKGRDPNMKRLVAIKMTLGYGDDAELLNRFYREAQSAGNLHHPNIVTIHELGDQDGTPYMVMEYIEGESLDSIIHSRKLPLEQKINIAIQLCDALSYAHQNNVIHRDIKPGNVMVVLKDFTIKIVDFGIARLGNEKVTRPGQLMGSVSYMSPEQIKDGARVDHRTDIFSAGVLLYQLLTNVLPFEGKDIGAILLKIIHEPPPPLSTYLESYPPELDRILRTALAKNVEQRYPTAERLAFDLTRVQDQLKREKISEYLQVIEDLCASHQWGSAREQILRLLRIDGQHARGNELLSIVEQQILLQNRSEQAQQLRIEAEQALSRHDLGEALNYLDRAVELESNNESLTALRESVAEQKARADQVFTLVHRAESAREMGEFVVAQKAVNDALLLDPHNREALGLRALIVSDQAEHNKQKQVHNRLEEARRRISSRSFTDALELLRQAEALSPHAPGVKELLKLALSGQEQEIRRKQLEALNGEIQDLLNREDFVSACAKADASLQTFPEDRSLIKLKKLAEKQRQTSEKRAFIERRIAAARQALDSPEPQHALSILQEALQRYPSEPALLSMKSVVDDSLRRREEERRKAQAIQEANEAIRDRHYREAVEILQATREQIFLTDVDELEELVQFAQEEAANYAVQQRIQTTAEQANRFLSAGEYQKAIDLLQLTLADYADDELHMILEDARRRLQELDELFRESIGTGRRLVRQNRFAEALQFLETQSERCRKSPEFNELLDCTRRDYARIQTFSTTKEKVRDALASEDFATAMTELEDFRKEFGDVSETVLLQTEIESARSRSAIVAMERALSDVRMLLMVRSLDSAENIIESVSQWQPYSPVEMQQQYQAYRNLIANLQEQVRERELKQKQDQARVADLETDFELAEGDADATERMSISKLHTILGQVTNIEEHYPDNFKIKSSIEELRKRLTVRLDELESFTQAAQQTHEQEVIESVNDLREKKDLQQAFSLLDHALEQNAQSAILLQARESLVVAQRRSERLSEAENLRRAGEFTAALALLRGAFEPGDAEAAALLAEVEADGERARRQKALAQALGAARGLVSAGQFSQAIEQLRQCLTQYPGESEVLVLLQSTEEQLQAKQESLLAAQRRSERLSEAENLRRAGEFTAALALLREAFAPGDTEAAALLAEVEANDKQARRQKTLVETLSAARGLISAGQLSRAIEELRQCLTENPGEIEVFSLLRSTEEQLHAENESLLAARRRSERLSEAENLRRAGKFTAAMTLLTGTFEQGDAEAAALLAVVEADDEQARRQKTVTATLSTARGLVSQGQLSQAIQDLQQCLTQYPEESEVLALLRSTEEQLQAERESLLATQRRSERLSEAENLRRAGEFTAALTLLTGAFEQGDAEAAALLAEVEADDERARRQETVAATLSAARGLVSQGQLSQAIQDLQQCLSQYPGESEVLALLRSAEEQLQEERESQLAAQAALRAKVEAEEQARRQETVAETLSAARGLVSAGQFSRAIEDLRRCLTQYPEESEVLALLRSTEEQLQAERDFAGVRVRAETLITQRKYDQAIALADQNRQKGQKFEALLASIRQTVEEKRREEVIKDATNLQKSGRYREALEGVQRASPASRADAAVSELENILRKQVEEENRKQARDADLKKLLKIERQLSQGKSSASKTVLQDVGAIASSYAVDDEISSIAARIRAKVEPAAVPSLGPAPGRAVVPRPVPLSLESVATKAPLRAQRWSYPAVVATCALALAASVGASLYFWKAHSPPAAAVPARSTVAPPRQVDPVQAQQQAAIDAADERVAAGDLAGAQKVLQASPQQGPLGALVQQRLAGITDATKDQHLRALRQKEEQLFQQATAQVNGGQFASARGQFQQILGLGDGGTRKAEAQQYLDRTIPLREKEQDLFKQAEQASNRAGLADLQSASSLLDQVIALNGPRKADAVMLRARVVNDLNNKRTAKIQAGPVLPSTQLGQAEKEAGLSKPTSPSPAEIADNAFQQIQQRAQTALSSGDKVQLGVSRDELQKALQSAGPHAREASDLSDQVTKKLSALSQPSVLKTPVSPSTGSFSSTADEAAVREALERFNTAFQSGKPREVKSIWPSVDRKYTDAMRHQGYSFAMVLQPQGNIQINGNSAVVPCDLVSITTMPGGQAVPQSKKPVKVTLSKTGDGWVILDPLTSR